MKRSLDDTFQLLPQRPETGTQIRLSFGLQALPVTKHREITPRVAIDTELHYHLIVLNINSTSDHLSEHCTDCAAGWAGPGVKS